MNKVRFQYICSLCIYLLALSCSVPKIAEVTNNNTVPVSYIRHRYLNMASLQWRSFYRYQPGKTDRYSADEQPGIEYHLQEIEIAKNEILFRKGAILPNVNLHAGAGFEK